MSEFLEKFIELGQQIQTADFASEGIIVSGKEIFDTKYGQLMLVKDVIVTELIPTIIVHVTSVDGNLSYRAAADDIRSYRLDRLTTRDTALLAAIVEATSIFSWSLPVWLSSNQAHSMLTQGHWDSSLRQPVPPSTLPVKERAEMLNCSRLCWETGRSAPKTCKVCGLGPCQFLDKP